ncbi:MAG TPA: hypothetical protein DEG26_07970 [Chloroflexi bacterium]|nr:hypothetical protein [Chloroflexota bacterium]
MHQDAEREAERDIAELAAARLPARHDAEHHEGAGQHQASRRHRRAGNADRAGHRLAQRQPVRFLPDPRHDQDVVVLTKREQEDEHQEGQEEDQPLVSRDLDEQQHREPERSQVGQSDRGDQVDRCHQAAQDQRQQDADRHDRDRDDLSQVAVGYRADVIERRRLAAERLRPALRVPDPRRTAGKRLLVVDDVFTDGRTLDEVARALRLQGGATEVCGLALCRQPWREQADRPAGPRPQRS